MRINTREKSQLKEVEWNERNRKPKATGVMPQEMGTACVCVCVWRGKPWQIDDVDVQFV